MLRRCYTDTCSVFRHYGGRGITVCDRWRYGEDGRHGFQCFLADVGPRPSPKHSIDREDNDGNYRPGNVRWATLKMQRRNTRANRIIDICGAPMTMVEAVERWGTVPYDTMAMRLHRGWDETDALLTPPRQKPARMEVPF